MKNNFKLGQTVWVIERDECGDKEDYAGYLFLFSVRDYAFVIPRCNGEDDIDYNLESLAEDTLEEGYSQVTVIPIFDCFSDKDDVIAAFEGEDE